MKKKQTIKHYHDADASELTKKSDELQKAIDSAVLSRYTSPSKNVRSVKNLRKERAVVLTIRRTKELHHG